MSENKTKIWLGIGGYLMLGAGGVPAGAAGEGQLIMAQIMHADHAAKSEGGEGGEGGESGYTNEDPDQVFAVNLLLAKGHLHISQEMAGLGLWDFSAAHAQHPAAEIYNNVAPELKKRGAAPFEAELEALVEQVIENKSGAALDQAYATVIAKIDAAAATLDVSKRTSPAFTMASAMALLKQASAEYVIGVSGGKIVNLQEYQDANGFIWVADQLISSLDQGLPGMPEITAELVKLKSFWSTAARMDSMATPESDVLGCISRIELKAGKIK
ncbi:MAG: hypothetical protein ABL951_15460 [Alphaproteobacteria bacterium]